MDPAAHTVRNGSRLNQVLLVWFDPASLDEETRPHTAEGIVAYSAICSPVSMSESSPLAMASGAFISAPCVWEDSMRVTPREKRTISP